MTNHKPLRNTLSGAGFFSNLQKQLFIELQCKSLQDSYNDGYPWIFMKISLGAPVSRFDLLVAFVPVCLIGGAFYVCTILIPPKWETLCQEQYSREAQTMSDKKIKAICEKYRNNDGRYIKQHSDKPERTEPHQMMKVIHPEE